MKQKLIIVIVLLLSLSRFVNAQDKKPQMLVFSGGISYLAKQDLIYSPFIHSDRSLHSYELKFQRERKRFQYATIGFSYNSSQLGEPYEMGMGDHTHMILPHEFLNVHFTYGLGKRIQESAQSISWAGGSLKSEVQAGFYNFALSNMFGYFISQSANLWYRRSYHFNSRHRFYIHAELPVLSWIARPPYMAEDDEFIENISSHKSAKTLLAFARDGQLATWNKVQRFDLNVSYMYPVTGLFNIGADYRFAFIHSAKPRTLLSYQHHLNFITAIKF